MYPSFKAIVSCSCLSKCGEILRIYREKDVIKKNFHQLKNGLDFRRFKTHWNKTTDGKMFVGFLALILRTCMLSILRNTPDTKKFTFEKILIELTKMRIIRTQSGKNTPFTLTKKQKDIIRALNIKDDSMK